MYSKLGNSIYLNLIRNKVVSLDDISGDTPVFLSLHISEEFDDKYNDEIYNLCKELNKKNCKILADISKKTLKQFNKNSINELAKELNLWGIRVDYGFDTNEIIEIVKEFPVALNASTISIEEVLEIKKYGEVFAMHNFYPRKETGLDDDYFNKINSNLKNNNIKVIAFIPGKEKREPIYEGLPTLESQRYKNAYVNYLEMIKKYQVDEVYLGDPLVETKDLNMINKFINEDIISLPVKLNEKYNHLYNVTFTNRIDSPNNLIRIIESREYSCINEDKISPVNTIKRTRGSITIDNELYKRYCGEIQITKVDYPADKKVNVIGEVSKEYLDVLDLIDRGNKFIFV